MSARLYSVSRLEDSWAAVIEVEYKGRTYNVRAEKLLRPPSRVEASMSGEYMVIKLLDEKGKGLATCHIHVSHLEKGCVDCKCLLKPAE